VDDVLRVLDAIDSVIGVLLGAGLAYLFGTRSRHQQEERENDTRWYDARLQAYVGVSRAFTDSLTYMTRPTGKDEDERTVAQGFAYAVGAVRFLGSDEAKKTAGRLLIVVTDETKKGPEADPYSSDLGDALRAFEAAGREDLGFVRAKPNARWW
jgi:hypothetical protein